MVFDRVIFAVVAVAVVANVLVVVFVPVAEGLKVFVGCSVFDFLEVPWVFHGSWCGCLKQHRNSDSSNNQVYDSMTVHFQ